MVIAVIDGQGGGMGKAIVERLRCEFGEAIKIIVLGTNALATSLMLKAGGDEGASGENAIVFSSQRVDVIMGPIGIIAANSMLGELTPQMAKSIAQSPAIKILIPVNKCNIKIAGIKNESLPNQIDSGIQILKDIMI